MEHKLPENIAEALEPLRPIVKEMFRAGEASGKYWAAKWIEESAKNNPSNGIKEFAANMAMSIRAAVERPHPRILMELSLTDRRAILGDE